MNRVVLTNAKVGRCEDDDLKSIEIIEGVISNISSETISGDAIDLKGNTILPGFIDTHNHGALGFDVNTADAAGFVEIGRFLVKHGITSWVPTIVPDSHDRYKEIISAVSEARASGEVGVAEIVGIHYEGIFSNKKVCGALRPEYFREYRSGDLEEIPSIDGIAHLFTFAPEIEGAVDLAEDLVKKTWIPSIGHTDAKVSHLESVYEKGVRRVTHLYNAMSGIHHRTLGVAGWALAKEDVCCEIIADGIHVSDEILKLTLRAKGSEGLALVSDSVAPTGLGDGEYDLWGEKISVSRKRTENERGSIAGSVITIADAVERMTRLGASSADIVAMASFNQAKSLGLCDRGEIAVGKKADIVALDPQGKITFVMKSGVAVPC